MGVEFVVGWLFMAVVTAVVAAAKGRSVMPWLLLGLVFGVFAALYVAFAPRVEAKAGAQSMSDEEYAVARQRQEMPSALDKLRPLRPFPDEKG